MPRKPKRTPAQQFKKDFDQQRRDQFVQHIRQGMRRGQACDAVFGENNPTRRKLLRDFIDGDVEFADLVRDAEVEATEHVEEALYQAAVSGSVAAAKLWLEMMKGPVFPEQRGRPPKPEEEPEPFGDLGNVTLLDPRARRAQREP